MDAFKIADFAHSIFPDAAAWTVIETFRTVFNADKFMLRQPAFAA